MVPTAEEEAELAQKLRVIRSDYARAGLAEDDLDVAPSVQIARWLDDAIRAAHPEPTAMTLATASKDGEPSARVVLLRGVDSRGLVFFTNYESAKGRDLGANPRATANLFWVLLERQIRVSGAVVEVDRAESEEYFASRPRESQIGAWASKQSDVIADRAALESRVAAVRARFGDDPIPCPPRWGGYRIALDRVEFWQGRPSRLHDRLVYVRTAAESWRVERLSP